MLLKIDQCSICANNGSIFSALLTIISLYRFVSPLMSSILFNCLLCYNSCCSVSVLIISPDSVFLHTKLACSPVKYCPILGLLSFISPPILGLRGKDAVGPFLPFISLNDSLSDFLLNLLYLIQVACFMLEVLLIAPLPNLTFVKAVQSSSLP